MHSRSDQSWIRTLIPALVVGLGLVASVSLAVWARAEDRRAFRRLLTAEVKQTATELEAEIQSSVAALERLAARTAGRQWSAESWQADARMYLRDFPALKSLHWFPANEQGGWQLDAPDEMPKWRNPHPLRGKIDVMLGDDAVPHRIYIEPDSGELLKAVHTEARDSSGYLIGQYDLAEDLNRLLAEERATGRQYAIRIDGRPVTPVPAHDPVMADHVMTTFLGFESDAAEIELVLYPSRSLANTALSTVPETIAAAGTVLSILLGAILFVAQRSDRRARELERLSEQLEVTKERLEIAVHGSDDGLWDWDLQTDAVWYSRRFRELLGYEEHDPFPNVLGTFRDHLHPDDAEQTFSAIQRSQQCGEAYDVSYRLRMRNGGYRHFRARGKAFRDSDGQPVRMAGSLQDITLFMEAERERQELVHALRERVKEMTALHNLLTILQEPDQSLDDMLGKIVMTIPPGWQYPEDCIARIAYGSHMHASDDWTETEWCISADFQMADGEVGVIEVAYLREHPAIDGDVFLREERELLRLFADRIAARIDHMHASDELEQSERRMRTLIANLPGAVYRCRMDDQWTMLYLSDGAEELTGYPASEFLGSNGMSFADLIDEQDNLRNAEIVQASIERGEPFQLEYRLRHADGPERWVREYGQAVRGFDGRVTHLDGVLFDVTDQHLADKAFNEQSTLLANALNTIPYAVFWKDRDSVYLGCNANFASSAGVDSPEQIVGKTDYDLVWKREESDFFRQCDRDVMEAGEPMLNIEEQQRQADGSERALLTTKVPLRDETGEVFGMLGMFMDITDRKRSEEALEAAHENLIAVHEELTETERRFREAIERSPNPMMMHTEDGEILHVNQAWLEITGYRREDLADVDAWMRLAYGTQAAEMRESFDRYYQADAVQDETIEVYPRTRDGDERIWLLTSADLGYVTDGRRMRLATAVDVTDQRRSEQAQAERDHLSQAMRAMEKVMAVVGHELRTPLAALRATSEFLLTDAIDEDVRRTFLTSMHDEVIRMAELVNNVLEAARINSGIVKWNWGEVDLAPAVENAFAVIGPLVNQQNVALSAQIPEGLKMRGDREAIQRLVINFVSNSAKHTPSGAIAVSANESFDGPDRWIELQIRDTGGGIPSETIEKLGRAFVLNSGVVGSDYVKGTGLGLAICGGIAAAHGGTIAVASEEGDGTVFTVRLRADLDDASIQTDDIEIHKVAA